MTGVHGDSDMVTPLPLSICSDVFHFEFWPRVENVCPGSKTTPLACTENKKDTVIRRQYNNRDDPEPENF